MDRVLWEKTGHWTTTKMQCSPRLLRTVNTALSDELPRARTNFQPGAEVLSRLPLRMAEFGSCHRNEPSGSLMA